MSAAQSLSARPALVFSEAGDAFARSVAARYANIAAAEVRADAGAQEFACVGDGSYCTRTVSDGPCVDAWTIDIASEGTVTGRNARLCMGAEEE